MIHSLACLGLISAALSGVAFANEVQKQAIDGLAEQFNRGERINVREDLAAGQYVCSVSTEVRWQTPSLSGNPLYREGNQWVGAHLLVKDTDPDQPSDYPEVIGRFPVVTASTLPPFEMGTEEQAIELNSDSGYLGRDWNLSIRRLGGAGPQQLVFWIHHFRAEQEDAEVDSAISFGRCFYL